MTHDLVLAIHPASRGFGWILFEGPKAPFDWGTIHSEKHRAASARLRVWALLEKYQPDVLVLERFEKDVSQRRPRTRRLCRSIVRAAGARGIAVECVLRSEIRAHLQATSRRAVAAQVAAELVPLQPYLPRPQQIWIGESLTMALFCAAACALTYYASPHRN